MISILQESEAYLITDGFNSCYYFIVVYRLRDWISGTMDYGLVACSMFHINICLKLSCL